MNLSRSEEIAVAILIACAQAGGERLRTRDIAPSAGTSREQAAQIVYLLRRGGLVDAARGRNGGIRLAVPASRITLGDILCLIGSRAPEPHRSTDEAGSLAAIVQAADAKRNEALASFTIADFVEGRVGEKLICFNCDIRLGIIRHGVPKGQAQNAPVPTTHRQSA